MSHNHVPSLLKERNRLVVSGSFSRTAIPMSVACKYEEPSVGKWTRASIPTTAHGASFRNRNAWHSRCHTRKLHDTETIKESGQSGHEPQFYRGLEIGEPRTESLSCRSPFSPIISIPHGVTQTYAKVSSPCKSTYRCSVAAGHSLRLFNFHALHGRD